MKKFKKINKTKTFLCVWPYQNAYKLLSDSFKTYLEYP